MLKNLKPTFAPKNIMINFLPLLLSTLLLGATQSSDLPSDISSDFASYDGDFLRLVGEVKLYHDLGHMQAHQALLKKGGKDFPFTNMHLEEDVSFSFQNDSELFCDEAQLDFIGRFGTVLSQDKLVLYRSRKKEALDLVSRQIDFQFEEQDEHILEISSLMAKEAVHIDYANKYHLDADQAYFDNETLSTSQINTPCHLTHLQDEVEARQITIHLESRNLEMESPRGKVSSFFFPESKSRPCNFSARFLFWDDEKDVMTLKQNILIQDEFLGTIEGEETIRFFQKEQFGKYVMQAIIATGPTTLRSAETAEEKHALTSFGTLTLDRDLLLVTATSPKQNGTILFDKQLIFVKGDLSLQADEASLEYSLCQMELKPTSVNLKGRVRLLSNDPETPFRCGVADEVLLNPQTKEMRLLAQAGHQVLFWHEEQNLRLSAQEIVVIPDPVSGKDVIKGIGNVRFSFNEEQQETFHKLFPQGEVRS
jgi:lipopolysaccharide export system protein LptA